MYTIFTFTNKKEIYSKCLYASIVHAVMIGKYNMLSDEIAWDGNNYLFQNMSGVKGVIAFSDDAFACGIQKADGPFLDIDACTDSASEKVKKMAYEEVYPYLLLENDNGEDVVSVSSFFHGDDKDIISCSSEPVFMSNCDNIFLPYLYGFDDMRSYWNDYYESTDEQRQLIDTLYHKKVEKGERLLDEELEIKLRGWFGDNWENCRNALLEIDCISLV